MRAGRERRPSAGSAGRARRARARGAASSSSSSRWRARSRMPSSNSSQRPPPRSLARYIAVSASRSSVPASPPTSRRRAMPMLAVTWSSWPREVERAARARRSMRSAIAAASCAASSVLAAGSRTRRRRAARPCRRRAATRRRRSATSHEQLVAGGVAERVVDELEPVEVEEQHGERACRRGRRASAWRCGPRGACGSAAR